MNDAQRAVFDKWVAMLRDGRAKIGDRILTPNERALAVVLLKELAADLEVAGATK